ncbi:MAG: hypothetical protein JNL24_03800 [Bacteroidia bacterium]|nr:hypothetical protein [Bacteroidia bacterium]
MKKIKLILFILLFSAPLFSQAQKDCKQVLDKIPYFVSHAVTEPNDSINNDFDILKSCGNLDSIDSELLSGPMIASILMQHATEEKLITYHTILKSFNSFKQSENYSKLRNAIIASKTLENKIVSIEVFEKDKELLLQAGLPPSELEPFKKFIQSNDFQNITYKQAFALYSLSKDNTASTLPEKLEFTKLTDLESAIKTGKGNGKKVLLYFSGYACVNARKIEDRVLIDNQVKSIIAEKFNYFIAYTDDKTEDIATGSTVGAKFIKLQTEQFKTNYQPYFCIINESGKVLSEIGYTNNTQEFIEFLNKGLK